MIDFILLLVLTSFWCVGVWNAFDEGMIFGKVGIWARGRGGKTPVKAHLPAWAIKPLFDCPFCMSSIHGFASYAIFHGIDWMVIPFIVCLSGLNYVIINLTE